MIVNTGSSSLLTHDCDVARISTERFNVLFDPLQSSDLG